MAKPLIPLVRSGGFYSSRRLTPLVYRGGFTRRGSEDFEPVEKTVSGAIVTVADALEMPAKSVTVAIEPVQDLHGYENPWPAGGGKNLIPIVLSDLQTNNTNGTWTNNVYALNGMMFTVNADGSITVNGTSTADIFFNYLNSAHAKAIAAGNYVLHRTGSADINVSVGKSGAYWGAAKMADVQLSLDADATFTAYSYVASGKTLTNFVLWPMLEAGTTATDFAPYSNICPITGWTGAEISHRGADTSDPDVISITFPSEAGTVYGGTLDLTNGKLVVDREMVDLGTLTYTRMELPAPVAGSGYVFRANNFNMKANSTKCICSEYPYLGSYIPLGTHDKAIGYIYVRNICVRDDDYIDATNFANAMSGVQLVYELATPITYDLTPQEIAMFRGANTLWANTGDTTLTYLADGN